MSVLNVFRALYDIARIYGNGLVWFGGGLGCFFGGGWGGLFLGVFGALFDRTTVMLTVK